jgi:hypothetical protein
VLLNATEMGKMRGLPHEEFLKWHKTQKWQHANAKGVENSEITTAKAGQF